jgi:hypothetical protein
MAFALALSLAIPQISHAVYVWYDPFTWFSSEQVPALDRDGHQIFDRIAATDAQGRPILGPDGRPQFVNVPKYLEVPDPLGDNILKLGFDFTFDPTKIQIVTDLSTASAPLPSTFGFLCDFSANGNCPQPGGPNLPAGYGDPLPGSTYSFLVDNTNGRVTLAYDFSSTPVTVLSDTNFFAFLWEPVVVGLGDANGNYSLPANFGDPFTQHPESPAQYCTTESTLTTGLQCTTIQPGSATPEPSAAWLLGTGLALLGLNRSRYVQRAISG